MVELVRHTLLHTTITDNIDVISDLDVLQVRREVQGTMLTEFT